LPGNSNGFWKFSASKVYGESSVRIFTIYVPQSEGIFFEINTHFASSLPVRFTEKVMDAVSRFMRPKTKPFFAKFRHTLEVLPPARFTEKSYCAFSRFVCRTNKQTFTFCKNKQHFVKTFGHVLQF